MQLRKWAVSAPKRQLVRVVFQSALIKHAGEFFYAFVLLQPSAGAEAMGEFGCLKCTACCARDAGHMIALLSHMHMNKEPLM